MCPLEHGRVSCVGRQVHRVPPGEWGRCDQNWPGRNRLYVTKVKMLCGIPARCAAVPYCSFCMRWRLGLLLLLALLLMLLLLLLLALLIELLLLSTLLVVSCSCVQVVVVHFNFIILTHRMVRLWLVNVLMCCTLINLELRMHVLMLLMLLVSVCHCVQVVVVHCDVIMSALIMAHLQLDRALVCCKHAPHEPLLAFCTLYYNCTRTGKLTLRNH